MIIESELKVDSLRLSSYCYTHTNVTGSATGSAAMPLAVALTALPVGASESLALPVAGSLHASLPVTVPVVRV